MDCLFVLAANFAVTAAIGGLILLVGRAMGPMTCEPKKEP